MPAIDVTDSTFQSEVLTKSEESLVIVDLWASWCAPCRTLGPIIERVVDEYGGDVILAKVDVDANPSIANAFQVQSIPAVYAVKDGKVVDGFIGAQPESAVRAFIEKLAVKVKSPADLLFELGDEQSLRDSLDLDPGHEGAICALAEILIDRGEANEALDLLARIPDNEETMRLKAKARLGDESQLGDEKIVSELDQLLNVVRDDEEARQKFRDLLEVLVDRDIANKYRRALASRLF
ncbi:MAG: thioredoxin [Actinomycetota bacterium]|nr:thioredoxin [Actinomycetota bacterium]